MTVPRASAGARLRWGAIRGLIVFGPWTAILLGLWIMRGPRIALSADLIMRVDVLTRLFAPLAAVMGGVLGLLERWAHQDPENARIAGILAALPWAGLWILGFEERGGLGLGMIVTYVLLAGVMGWLMASTVWRHHWEDEAGGRVSNREDR